MTGRIVSTHAFKRVTSGAPFTRCDVISIYKDGYFQAEFTRIAADTWVKVYLHDGTPAFSYCYPIPSMTAALNEISRMEGAFVLPSNSSNAEWARMDAREIRDIARDFSDRMRALTGRKGAYA